MTLQIELTRFNARYGVMDILCCDDVGFEHYKTKNGLNIGYGATPTIGDRWIWIGASTPPPRPVLIPIERTDAIKEALDEFIDQCCDEDSFVRLANPGPAGFSIGQYIYFKSNDPSSDCIKTARLKRLYIDDQEWNADTDSCGGIPLDDCHHTYDEAARAVADGLTKRANAVLATIKGPAKETNQ